jgi:ATP-binding cassette subfamily E protein 1
LVNKLKPNLGQFENPPDWPEIMKRFKGSEIQAYFTRLLEDNYKTAFKMQFVDQVPKMVTGKVLDILKKKDQRGLLEELIKEFTLQDILDREIGQLSGGELQRFTVMITLLQNVNIFVFDEPSSYLDVKQRLVVSNSIRKYAGQQSENYVIVVEHDLSILDYISDFVCCLFGKAAAFGVVSLPYSVKEGINVFLDGYLPKDNVRFRDDEISFKQSEVVETDEEKSKLQKDDNKTTNYYP